MTAVKIILFIIALFVLLWLLRGAMARRGGRPADPKATRRRDAPQPMLVCAHCGVHLPRDEALPGKGGVFCGDAHRTAYEQARSASE